MTIQLKEFEQQARPVLVATLGGAPQVITRTLDLLLQEESVLDQVVIIHTSGVRSRNPLWSNFVEIQNYLEAAYPQLTFVYEPIKDREGETIWDVRSSADAEFTFATLFKVMRDLKAEGRQIHGLIAGGRKTMILYTMVAAQLLSEADDHLWHLVSTVTPGEPHLDKNHSGPGDYLLDIPIFRLATSMPMVHALIVDSHDPIRAMRLYEQTVTPAHYKRMQAFYQTCDEEEQKILQLRYEGYSVKQIIDLKLVNLSRAAIYKRLNSLADRFYTKYYGKPLRPRPQELNKRLIEDLRPLLRGLASE